MALKNTYIRKTTTAMKCAGEVQEQLVSHGAVGIQMMYDGDKRVSEIRFAMPYKDGRNIAFSIPCEWRKFQQVLKRENARGWEDEEYAYRVAWADIRDLVEAQMVFYETGMTDVPQLFLGFSCDENGNTLYKIMQEKGFDLLLGDGK